MKHLMMCGALVLALAGQALAEGLGLYVGIEGRAQRAELELEKAMTDIDSPAPENLRPYITEAQGRNSINAVRVGYLAELATDFSLDASLAYGSIDTAFAADVTYPTYGYTTSSTFLDSASYLDISVGVRGSAGNVTYSGMFRLEKSSLEEVSLRFTGFREEEQIEQRVIALEGTVGTTGDVRAYAGVGLHFLKGERTQTDNGVTDERFEFKYDSPLVIFGGVETSAEKTGAFVRVSVLGERFLSTWAGVTLKF